ncbi:hypothetical protein F383_31809 [Gossypium arboreum]|uniref:Uncharacterized protein n=1 Tax=Gossypium arboreum TaxID=29729 RepID=A0A0B0N4R8_GOSAR|nr:hypothetical protein F383_31809 [Gossypium arboreum]
MNHRNRFRYVLSCKTTSGTLVSICDLRVRPCLGHLHHI